MILVRIYGCFYGVLHALLISEPEIFGTLCRKPVSLSITYGYDFVP